MNTTPIYNIDSTHCNPSLHKRGILWTQMYNKYSKARKGCADFIKFLHESITKVCLYTRNYPRFPPPHRPIKIIEKYLHSFTVPAIICKR
jgi:hypothetical protein